MARPPLSLAIPRKNKQVSPDPANVAAQILGFLAADGDRLGRFLELTGLTPQTLRKTAVLPGFAESLLDYLCADERLLTAFAAEHGRDPAEIDALRQRLHRRDDETD